MTSGATDGNDHAREFLHGEYATLRDEMVKRVALRQRLVEITLASAAAVLTINTINLTGADFARVLLVYPILVMFLALAWLHHGLRPRFLATYLKEEIEPKFNWRHDGEAAPVGYETWLAKHKRPWEQQLGTMAVKLMFILIQFLVFWLGFLGAAPSDAAFTYFGVLAIVVTIGALFVYPTWFL